MPGDINTARTELCVQINAMELKQLDPDMPQLLRELGIIYDPDRLALVLKRKGGKVRGRAIQIAASFVAFLARVLAVRGIGLKRRSCCL